MILQNVFDDARGFKVPMWSYGGKFHTVDTAGCACFDGQLLGQPKDTHVCECPFDCSS